MSDLRQPVPWEYREVVLRYLRPSDAVLDIGTGGGERLRDLAGAFGSGLGIYVDPEMVRFAAEKSGAPNLRFRVCSAASSRTSTDTWSSRKTLARRRTYPRRRVRSQRSRRISLSRSLWKLDAPRNEEDRLTVGVMGRVPAWRRERFGELVQPQAVAAQRREVG